MMRVKKIGPFCHFGPFLHFLILNFFSVYIKFFLGANIHLRGSLLPMHWQRFSFYHGMILNFSFYLSHVEIFFCTYQLSIAYFILQSARTISSFYFIGKDIGAQFENTLLLMYSMLYQMFKRSSKFL